MEALAGACSDLLIMWWSFYGIVVLILWVGPGGVVFGGERDTLYKTTYLLLGVLLSQ